VARLLVDHLHPLFRAPKVDLWHYPKGHLPLLCRFKSPVIGTVHDVILQHYVDKYPRDRSATAYRYWLAVLKRSISGFDSIVTVSRTSESAIRTFCDRHRLRCPSIYVTYEGFHVDPAAANPGDKDDAVVHLCSREPHKRTATLLTWWGHLRQTTDNLPALRLIGTMRPEEQALAQSMPGVEIKGRLPRPQLEREIARARALLLPSEIEGFGLPAVEAYALGAPVVYVRGTAVEEIIGPGTCGAFSLEDIGSFEAALAEVLAMSTDSVEAHGRLLAKRFAWRQTAAATAAAYQQLLEQRR
jgi:glycosyltransferase involved in cell wall biosynthesis